MPQTIVETKNCSKPRKCDVAVSNFVTLGKGDESPGSDSSLNALFTNEVSPKNDPWGPTSCAGRETVDDKNEEGYENRHLNHINDLYSEYDFSNGCPLNKHKDIEIRFSNGVLDSSLDKSFDSNNMGIVKDTESEILGDFSNLLPSINSSNNDSNGVSSYLKTSLDWFNVKHSTSNKPEDTESEVLGDFSDLLSSITSPSKVSTGVSSDPKSNLNGFHVIPPSNGPDFNFCGSSTLFPNGSLISEDSNSQNSGTLSDILSSISIEENNSTLNGQESRSSSCIPKGSSISGDSNSKNNGTLSDILSSIYLEEKNSTPSGFKLLNSNLFFEDFEVPCMNRPNPEFSKMNPNSPADNLKPELSKLKSSILSPDSNLCHKDVMKVVDVNQLNSNFKQTNRDPQNHTLADILSTISPLKDNPNNDILAVSNGSSKSNNQDIFMDSWLNFNNDNYRIPTSRINVPERSSIKSPMHNKKNGEFSFFSVSPENMFSDMVSKLKKDVDLQNNAEDNNTTGITMLDLFKSVNSDSSSSLSEYLNTESEDSFNDKNTAETVYDLCEVMDIDLSSCVKTNNDDLNIISSEKCLIEDCTDTFKNDRDELPPQIFMRKGFPETDCLKRPRMNLKQSLFAKSLSCKLKKNPVVLQKVAKIKIELFEKYFNRPSPNIEAKKILVKNSAVNESNNCMVTFHGHRICTVKGLEDVKCS